MTFYPKRIGEPMFSGGMLAALIIPLIAETVLTSAIGLIDSIMVAQISEAAMSGVALVDTINMLLLHIFAALGTGGTVVTSQYLGRREAENARTSAKQVFFLNIVLGTLVTLICITLRGQILSLLYGGIENDVMDNCLIYFLITAISYPFMNCFGTGAALFRSMGNSRLPLIAAIIMNLLNVAGNALFIFVFNLGAAGAAWATLFSRIVGAAIVVIALRNPKLQVNISRLIPYRPNFPMIKNILAVGIPTGLENGIFQIGKVLVQSMISGFGTAAIAASTIGNNISIITVMPGMAIGIALVTVSGQCVGAGKYDQARRYTVGFTGLATGCITLLNIIVFLFTGPIIAIFEVSGETEDIARYIIYMMLFFSSFLWSPGFIIPNALRSANDAKFTMLWSIVSMWAFRVGVGYLLAYIFDMGVVGVWWGSVADWIARSAIFVVRFLGDKWTKHKILSAGKSGTTDGESIE